MRYFLKVKEMFSFEEYKDNLTDLISLNRDRANIDKDV